MNAGKELKEILEIHSYSFKLKVWTLVFGLCLGESNRFVFEKWFFAE